MTQPKLVSLETACLSIFKILLNPNISDEGVIVNYFSKARCSFIVKQYEKEDKANVTINN